MKKYFTSIIGKLASTQISGMSLYHSKHRLRFTDKENDTGFNISHFAIINLSLFFDNNPL